VRALVVEDGTKMAALLRRGLQEEGFAVDVASNGEDGSWLGTENEYDVILLDVMLPDRSGFEFCAELRNRGVQTPVLMLTARGDVLDRVTGLRIGADDYLSKPFAVPELIARIEALRRRANQNDRSGSGLFEFGDVCVNLYQRSVSRSGQPLELTRLEFNMLSHLIRNRGRVVLRDELLRAVWGYRALPFTRTVDVHMWQLRRKLEADPQEPRFLRTVHGAGYLFAWERPEGPIPSSSR
jgi:two-component system, OmpR family, alkaline phosphatase synthesis response regulator PhoP